MSKYVCVHGHFYQPPRENPWLEAVEPQDSAAPYHDWNERVTAECYEPNTASRVLDEAERIVDITNNYSRISFNFGPSLLAWMERAAPETYAAVLSADEESRARFGGHGSALAQAYSHVILPLAARRDKEIQVAWGIRDFESRFQRPPEGMWLPETAVDLETLEVLAAHGIRFTILAPHQAARVRRLGDAAWSDVSGGRIDPTRAYIQRLPSGASIVLFFYEGSVSRAVAFEGLLHRGERFAERLLSILPEDDEPRLAHIATDGESYGHHHRHGDMALAFALRSIESGNLARLTNYGEFLALHPPRHEVEIFENTSWSCAHGVERWRSDCGCHTGGPPWWIQAWRAPLRDALDWLRERAEALFAERASAFFDDPERAVRDSVELVRDRNRERAGSFLDEHGAPDSEEERVTALRLLELRFQLQLMFTSCGWFFNDLAGIETIQVMQYAGRAVQLMEEGSEERVEEPFLERLGRARSNRLEAGTGRDIYERHVRPAKVTWEMLGAHYAISSLFESYPERASLYCYEAERQSYEAQHSGRMELRVGKVRLTSTVTTASEILSFGALRLGDDTVTAGVRRFRGEESFQEVRNSLSRSFENADTTAVLRTLDEAFGPRLFDLNSLFGEEQRRIVDSLLRSTIDEAESALRQLYERHSATMRFLADLSMPSPRALSVAAEVVLNANLRRAIEQEPPDEALVESLLRAAGREGVSLEETTLAYAAGRALEESAERFFESLEAADLERLRTRLRIVRRFPFEVDLSKVQNLYFRRLESTLEARRAEAPESAEARAWLDHFHELGDELSIRLPDTESS